MRLQYLFIVALTSYLSIWLSSCTTCSTKTVNCPGFNDTVLTSWFPYKDKDQLIYTNNTGERDTFTLINTETSAPYDINVGGLSPSKGCSAYKNFWSEEGDTTGRNLTIYLNTGNNIYTDSSSKWAELRLKHTLLDFIHLTDTGFSNITIIYQNAIINHLPSVSLGGKTFNNVISAYIDTANGKINGIYKIYYGRNQGIVAYETYPSVKIWVKQ